MAIKYKWELIFDPDHNPHIVSFASNGNIQFDVRINVDADLESEAVVITMPLAQWISANENDVEKIAACFPKNLWPVQMIDDNGLYDVDQDLQHLVNEALKARYDCLGKWRSRAASFDANGNPTHSTLTTGRMTAKWFFGPKAIVGTT